MSKPTRIQLIRTLGWKKPDNTIKVDRSTRYGNPHRIGFPIKDSVPVFTHRISQIISHDQWKKGKFTAELAVAMYRSDLMAIPVDQLEAFLSPLRGKNLMCWCKPDAICHADVLLDLANKKHARRNKVSE